MVLAAMATPSDLGLSHEFELLACWPGRRNSNGLPLARVMRIRPTFLPRFYPMAGGRIRLRSYD
jgi:hypothetical protein